MKKVLCVCLGNSDRSPLMAAVLKLFLEKAGHQVQVESAGVLEFTKLGGPASQCAMTSAKRIGLDLSSHNKCWVRSLDLSQYDLFVCADVLAADKLFSILGYAERIFKVNIENPWPSTDQRDHDMVAEDIMAKMYRVVTRYFAKD